MRNRVKQLEELKDRMRKLTATQCNTKGYLMIFRPHKGSLHKAMSEAVELESVSELVKHINENVLIKDYERPLEEKDIEIKHYGIDKRIGWDTHIVSKIKTGREKSKRAFVLGFLAYNISLTDSQDLYESFYKEPSNF